MYFHLNRLILACLQILSLNIQYLDNKELAIFYAVVMACHSEIESINKIFTQLYERIVKIHTSDHQKAKALMILMNTGQLSHR